MAVPDKASQPQSSNFHQFFVDEEKKDRSQIPGQGLNRTVKITEATSHIAKYIQDSFPDMSDRRKLMKELVDIVLPSASKQTKPQLTQPKRLHRTNEETPKKAALLPTSQPNKQNLAAGSMKSAFSVADLRHLGQQSNAITSSTSAALTKARSLSNLFEAPPSPVSEFEEFYSSLEGKEFPGTDSEENQFRLGRNTTTSPFLHLKHGIRKYCLPVLKEFAKAQSSEQQFYQKLNSAIDQARLEVIKLQLVDGFAKILKTANIFIPSKQLSHCAHCLLELSSTDTVEEQRRELVLECLRSGDSRKDERRFQHCDKLLKFAAIWLDHASKPLEPIYKTLTPASDKNTESNITYIDRLHDHLSNLTRKYNPLCFAVLIVTTKLVRETKSDQPAPEGRTIPHLTIHLPPQISGDQTKVTNTPLDSP